MPLLHFLKSGLELPWDPQWGSLLDFAEENGVLPNYSCRAGTCDSCKTALSAGSINYTIEPMERPEEGHVLLCCAEPETDISLDL